MPIRRTLSLSSEERQELERVRDRDSRPYLRERAAALLKIADGQSVYAVAKGGLLKTRKYDTVLSWLNNYLEDRTLTPRPACNKRRAFSP